MDVPVQEYPWQGAFPETPNWSENFLLAGDDPQAGIGFWLHIGRWRHDLSMFRESVIVRLPDGSVIGHRAIGDTRSAPEGPGGPHYAIRVIEPGRKLTYSFSGGVRRLSPEAMRAGLVGEGPRVPMRYELTFESDADIWDLHKVGGLQDFLPAGHIEQMGRVTGWFNIAGERHAIDTIANRDHSLGPRDTLDLRNHQWMQGYFPNGISFLLFDAMTRADGKVVFSEAVVYEGDRMFPATLAISERCEDAARSHEPVSLRLEYAGGVLDIVSTGLRSDSCLSITSPNDILPGVYGGAEGGSMVLMEQSVSLRLNGEIEGYGCFERTVAGTVALESEAETWAG
ncbi:MULTISPECIES: hypothetical protein [unclassified Novosphingobium]|uniref:DUF7065 domain-containing protein n=1 Tax=unclassified Novosphingobium TaxID=2644732 RepID=UPI00135B99AD|nr:MULTISPECIES: hypothetical protein [unclassified Novosphingobium]